MSELNLFQAKIFDRITKFVLSFKKVIIILSKKRVFPISDLHSFYIIRAIKFKYSDKKHSANSLSQR